MPPKISRALALLCAATLLPSCQRESSSASSKEEDPTDQEPAAMMREFAAQPELNKTRGAMVANMYARADLRVPEQRQLVREFLLHPDRTQNELRAFAGVYPNANHAISHNLITKPVVRDGRALAKHDREVLPLIEKGLNDPTFAPVREHVQTMHHRVSNFVGQTNQ